MKPRSFLLFAALLALAPAAHAAAITWGTATTCAADTDVSTTGSLKFAYHWGDNATKSLNGVPFTGTAAGTAVNTTGVTISGTVAGSGNYFGTPTGLSAAYQSLLVGAVYGIPGTVTLNGLTAGRSYAVQIWYDDSRAGGLGKTDTLTSDGGNTVVLSASNSSSAGGVGQYTIGTFTADAATQAFTITSNSSAQINALQVRDTSPIITNTWVGTSGDWNTSEPNWAAPETTYSDGNAVVFPDDATGFTVNATVPVAPLSITVTNTNNAYIIGGGPITGSPPLVKSGANSLTLTGAATLGAITLNAGTLTLDGAAQLNGGTYAGGITNNGTLSYASSAAQTLSGAINGGGSLLKSGGSTLTLSGGSAYSGGTTVSAGTLTMTQPTATGDKTVGITLCDDNTLAQNLTLNAGVSSGYWLQTTPNITVANKGTGTVTIDVGGQNYFTNGNISVNRSATISCSAAVGGAYVIAGSGGKITGDLNGGTLTFKSTGAGSLYVGSGTVANDFIGTVALTQGTVLTWSSTAFGNGGNAVVMSGTGSLGLRAALTIADLTGASTNTINTSQSGSNRLTISSPNSADFAGVIFGTGGITKDGKGIQTLSGTNTYTGTTIVNYTSGGSDTSTLRVNGSLHASSAVTIHPSAILDGSGTINGSVTMISGATLGGNLTVKSALLTVPLGATLSPGMAAIGTLSVTNGLTLAGNARFDVNKAGGTFTSDQINGFTGITFGGTLEIGATGDALEVGDTFTLFVPGEGGTYDGAFTNVLGSPGAGLAWDVSQLNVDGTVRVKVMDSASMPVFSLAAGGYVGAQSVTITSATGGATIYYTTDDWTTTNTYIGDPIAIPVPIAALTLKAKATLDGLIDSPVAEATYATVISPVWTWDGNGSWTDPANWLSGVVANGAGINADFSTLTLLGGTNTVSLDGLRTIGSLKFGDMDTDGGDVYGWSLVNGSGGPLTLDNGANPPVIDVANATTAISVELAGTHGLLKTGAGQLTLSGGNSYSGGTVVSAGTLRTTADSALSNGSITLNDASTLAQDTTFVTSANTGGNPVSNPIIVANEGTGVTTLELAAQNAQLGVPAIQLHKATTIQANYNGVGGAYVGKYDGSSVVSGSVGTLTLKALGTGQLYFGGHNTFTGTVELTQGTVATQYADALGGSGNSVVMSGSATLRSGAFGTPLAIGDLTGTATNTINNGGQLLTISSENSADYAGVITGTGGLTKDGGGIQTLSGPSTYTGNTTVDNGTLALASSGSLTFKIGATSVSTRLIGSGTVTMDGTFNLDLTTADTTSGNLWTLVNVDTLAETFGSAFAMADTGGNTWAQVNDVWTMTTLAGKQWTFTESSGVLGVVSVGYTAWAESFPGLSDKTPEGDPDNDGIKNLMEYVIGGDPRFSSTEFLPKQTIEGTDLVLAYKRNDASETDTTQTGQWSVNLTDWTDIAPELVNENGTDPDDMKIVIPMSNALNGILFGRLQVTKP